MSETKPDPTPVLGLLNAFRSSQALFAAVELGVFEVLEAATSPLPLNELCKGVGERRGEAASEDGVDRLCRACVGLGLLDSPSPGSYALNPISRTYLLAGASTSLVGYCRHSAQLVWPLFGGLPAAVASGSNVWQQQLGGSAADIFARVYATPADRLRFLRGMHSFATLSAPAVVTAFDLSFATSLVDLGGATGAIAAAAVAAYPGLRSAVVVDLPQVVADAQAHFAPPADGPHAGRLSWLAADFFEQSEQLPQQVDVVVLSRILHDWDVPRCRQVLVLAHRILRPGGALLVSEMLLDPDRLGPVPTLLQDLNMLCQTYGRERSPEEYGQLLGAAGFEDVRARRTGTYLDAVLARKPTEGAPAGVLPGGGGGGIDTNAGKP